MGRVYGGVVGVGGVEVGGEWVQKRTMAFGSVAAAVVVMIHNQVV